MPTRILWTSPPAKYGAPAIRERLRDPLPTRTWTSAAKQRIALTLKKRVGHAHRECRVLNMYLYAPLFSAYLESLGLEPENLVYSEFTGQDMYRAWSRPRAPSRSVLPVRVIGIPHVYNLIFQKHQGKPLDADLLPHD